MTTQRLALGQWGEEQAVRFLRRRGYKIVERNYSSGIGEIDIIARNRRTLAFVEVKTRSSTAFGVPQEAVGKRKQRQIILAAQAFLAQPRWNRYQPRFDVIAIIAGIETEIEHIPAAFGVESGDV